FSGVTRRVFSAWTTSREVHSAGIADEMRHRPLHRCCGWVLAALLLSLTHGARTEAAERLAASATAPSPAAMAEYRRKLEEYTLARQKYEAEADAYWGSITDKR